MVWFKQQYLWMIISAAAAYVSCQELTSTLREGNHACPGEEVIFTCTVRGSQTLTTLILAWSSPEYIGQGDPLRFITLDMPGTNRTSMTDGNVTATLISNTNIDGVPTLVSELRIIADQASTVTCTSEATTSEDSAMFNVSAIPEVPLNIGATAILRSSENDCEVLVKWDPPANSLDITNYIVYIPALNINATTDSFIISLLLRDCPERFNITVAAINRFGCIGSNSSKVLVQLPPQSTSVSTSPAASEPSQFSAGDIAGIVIGTIIFFFLAILVIVAVLCGCIIILRRKEGIMPDAGADDTLELLPKEEDNNYVWELQKRATLQAKECYRKQSQHDFDKLGTEEDRLSVPIWMDDELDDSWKAGLLEAVQAINKAAPGLSLSITEDKNLAFIHVLAIDKPEAYTEGNILSLLQSTSGQADYTTKIHLGKWEDDTKEGISTRELFHALGVNQDNVTRFDPSSITLYQDKEANESAQRKYPADSAWWLIQPNKDSTKLSELDKVYLNLVYRPCRDTTEINARYKPKLGKTGIYYCGRCVMTDPTYFGDKCIDGICGPDDGPNCPACRTIKSPKVEEILKQKKWQGMTGRVYCGRPFLKSTVYNDGACGINNGPACPECVDLLNTEV